MTIQTKDRNLADLDIAATDHGGVQMPVNHLADSAGNTIDPATEATMAALLMAAQAIQTAAAALNTKTTAVNTGDVAGTVAVSNFPATQPVSAAALPLPAGAATDATLAALAAVQDELKTLNDTMLVMLSAILEKLPRVTGNDQAAVSIEAGSVGISANQTLAALNTINNVGGKYASGDNVSLAGCAHLYNQIIVS